MHYLQLLLFGFTFLDLLIKLMKMMLLYILYCPPPALPRDGKGDFDPWPFCIYWVAALPHPSCVPIGWRSGTLPPSCLPIGWRSGKLRLNMRSRVCPLEGEGGAWYNITTCRMAEGSKDPCISHVDASHGEWPRIESSLLFCNFFYIVKIIEKSLFSEGEIGFTRKKTSKTRNRYFFEFFDT